MAAKRRELLSPVDHAWFRMDDPTNLMMITGFFRFDRMLDLDRLITVTEQRMLRFDRFRQRIVVRGTLATWEFDPHFDIRQHIRRIALPSPGGKEALQELVSALMSTPLDPERPLWQWTVIEGVDGGSALVARLSHAIADGVALVSVLLSMTTDSAEGSLTDPLPLPPTRSNGQDPLQGALSSVVRAADRVVTTSLNALASDGKVSTAPGPLAVGAALAKLALMPPDSPTLFKGKLGLAKRAAWSVPVELDEVKRLGRAFGGTVNDLLLTATTGAIRRYLAERGHNVDGMNLRAAIPINLRSPRPTSRLGNKFGLAFLSLPVGEANPLDRLAVIRSRMEEIKTSAEPIVSFGVLNTIGILPQFGQDVVVKVLASKTTAVMTNVPGPRQPIYLAGAKIDQLMFWVPQSGRLGLGVSIFSYAGQVSLGIATDARMAPDPERIADAFNDEFAELADRA